MNLAVNARCDARRAANPHRGSSRSRSGAVHINQDARPGPVPTAWPRRHRLRMPGRLCHIFDPLVTTKKQGSGLGLATVYGIAKQHQGWVEVESQPGQGSIFRVFIPASNVQPKVDPVPATPETVRGGSETILVVEDEETVREFVVEVLRRHGYQTIVPSRPQPGALDGERQIHLLTDMAKFGGLMGGKWASVYWRRIPPRR